MDLVVLALFYLLVIIHLLSHGLNCSLHVLILIISITGHRILKFLVKKKRNDWLW